VSEFKVGDKVTAVIQADYPGGRSEIWVKKGKVVKVYPDGIPALPRHAVYMVKLRWSSRIVALVANDMELR
jgi:hypothetical protein